jgi:hypothetical protein
MLTKEDKERIEKEESTILAEICDILHDCNGTASGAQDVFDYLKDNKISFSQGKIEGFNEGIEAALETLSRSVEFGHIELPWRIILEEIETLKKPI